MSVAVPKPKSAIELDEWAMSHVDPELLMLEMRLFESAWFDYRALHPVTRTSLFFRMYYQVVLEYMRKQVDFNRAKYSAKYLSGLRLLSAKPAAISTFWRARQQADRLGIEYGTFIRSIISTFRDWGWKRIPSPNHMYSPASIDVAAHAWIDRVDSQMVWPASMACHAESQAWFKAEFDDWFIAQALKRPAWRYICEDALKKGLMSKQELTRALRKAKEAPST